MFQLTLLNTDAIPIEADVIAPDRLKGLSHEAIAALPIQHGNREVPLGSLFGIDGDFSNGPIEIHGDCWRIKGLGRGWPHSHLIIRGNAGMHVGAGMTGGRIDVYGDVHDWLGAEMRGGLIHVHGRAGNLVGAAYRGGPRGMRGGTILIDGDAGDEVGASTRRGLIAVGGRCGDMAGVAMIAGSLFACGGVGSRAGAGMKRGSIVVLHGPLATTPTFRRDCDYQPTYLQIYFRQLAEWGFPKPPVNSSKLFRRFHGDLLALGQGEILWALDD